MADDLQPWILQYWHRDREIAYHHLTQVALKTKSNRFRPNIDRDAAGRADRAGVGDRDRAVSDHRERAAEEVATAEIAGLERDREVGMAGAGGA